MKELKLFGQPTGASEPSKSVERDNMRVDTRLNTKIVYFELCTGSVKAKRRTPEDKF